MEPPPKGLAFAQLASSILSGTSASLFHRFEADAACEAELKEKVAQQEASIASMKRRITDGGDRTNKEVNDLFSEIDARKQEIAEAKQQVLQCDRKIAELLHSQKKFAGDLSALQLQVAYNFLCYNAGTTIEDVAHCFDELHEADPPPSGTIEWLMRGASHRSPSPAPDPPTALAPPPKHRRASLLMVEHAAATVRDELAILERLRDAGGLTEKDYENQLSDLDTKRASLRGVCARVLGDEARETPQAVSPAFKAVRSQIGELRREIQSEMSLLDSCLDPAESAASARLSEARRFEHQRASLASFSSSPVKRRFFHSPTSSPARHPQPPRRPASADTAHCGKPFESNHPSPFLRRALRPGESDRVRRSPFAHRYAAAACRALHLAVDDTTELKPAALPYRFSTHSGLPTAVASRPLSARPRRSNGEL